MAIDVNKVYRATLAILNKEQRGLLTPDQFNRLGRIAQLDLIKKSFFDYNKYLTKDALDLNDEYANIAGNIKEKIDVLSKEDSLAFTTGVAPTPSDLYLVINITTTSRTIEVQPVSKSELTYMNNSTLVAPSVTYPVYYHEASNIKIYPASISSATIDYIKMPADPAWMFTGGGTQAYTYDAGNSTDFELHPSDEMDLVTKILALAGVIIKDPTIIEVALQSEASNFNQQNVQ